MTDTNEKIRVEELKLEHELDQVEDDKKQITHISEEYEEFFHHTSSLFIGLEEQFSQNDFSWYINDHSEDLQNRKQHIFGDIEEVRQQLHKQNLSIEDEQNELFYKKKKLFANKESEMNGR